MLIIVDTGKSSFMQLICPNFSHVRLIQFIRIITMNSSHFWLSIKSLKNLLKKPGFLPSFDTNSNWVIMKIKVVLIFSELKTENYSKF